MRCVYIYQEPQDGPVVQCVCCPYKQFLHIGDTYSNFNFRIYWIFFNSILFWTVPFGLFTYFWKNRVPLCCWNWPQACASPVSSCHELGLEAMDHHAWTYSNSHHTAPPWSELYGLICMELSPSLMKYQGLCESVCSPLPPSQCLVKKPGMYSVLNNLLFSNITELATVHSLGVRLLSHIKFLGMNWLLS